MLAVKRDVITTEQSVIFRLVNNVVLSALIGLFGIFSNLINMIVFYKQQFTTTVNISFFALAVSDLMCLLTLEWFNLCLNPYLETSDLPFVPMEFQYLTGGWFQLVFGRITSWITVYITAERFLSVALPLKVKQIVSLRKTSVAMCAIFAINLMTLLPEFCIVYLDWKFVPERNKTLIGLVYRSFRNKADGLTYTLASISGMLSFVAVVILTALLSMKLAQQSTWHSTASANSSQLKARVVRDKKTMKLVVMIAAILIVCYTPGMITSLATVFEPEFLLVGTYKNSYFAMWSVALVTSAINSSVNIFLYYTMSTKFRETFNELFSRHIKFS